MRWVELDGPANFRDLGGVAVGGGRIRPGIAFRSDTLVGLSTADRRRIRDDLSVSTVIDLRSHEEVAAGITELANDGVAYHHLPIGRRLGSIRGRGAPSMTMADGYHAMFTSSLDTLAETMEVMASGVPFVVHCAGGKDRAGIAVATLLALLDAAPEAIADEYALTGLRFDRVMARLNAIPQYADVMSRVDEDSLSADPATMLGFLITVQQLSGSMSDALNPDPTVVTALRATLVAATPTT